MPTRRIGTTCAVLLGLAKFGSGAIRVFTGILLPRVLSLMNDLQDDDIPKDVAPDGRVMAQGEAAVIAARAAAKDWWHDFDWDSTRARPVKLEWDSPVDRDLSMAERAKLEGGPVWHSWLQPPRRVQRLEL